MPGTITGPAADPVNAWVADVWKKIGDINDIQLFPTDVIVAHYERKTVGGSGRILAAPSTQKEDRYQGKVGLVVRVGTEAFNNAPDAQFFGFRADVGDWAVYRHNDGREMGLCVPGTSDTVLIKVLKDGEIFMTVPRPDRVW